MSYYLFLPSDFHLEFSLIEWGCGLSNVILVFLVTAANLETSWSNPTVTLSPAFWISSPTFRFPNKSGYFNTQHIKNPEYNPRNDWCVALLLHEAWLICWRFPKTGDLYQKHDCLKYSKECKTKQNKKDLAEMS